MSKILFTGYLLLSAGLSCAAPFSPTDLPSWPRMSAPIFGCQLEQRGGYKDADFNCANRKQRRDWGNVCHITRFSYAGPQLSPALARQLQATYVDLKQFNPRQELIVLLPEAQARRAVNIVLARLGLTDLRIDNPPIRFTTVTSENI